MTGALAAILRTYLQGLPFVDRLAGLVRTVTITGEDGKRKAFPVACNVTNADCTAGRYQDLVPDSSRKSVMYFEDGGTVLTGLLKGDPQLRSTIRLVGWLNLKKMGLTDCDFATTAITNIIKNLPWTEFNSPANGFVRVKLTGLNVLEKSSAIFSRYTYDEAVTQYLLYPYDYFGLNLTVEYTVRRSCIEDAVIPDIELCDDNSGNVNPGGDNAGAKQGDLLYWDVASGMWKRLAAGVDGHVLTSAGPEHTPAWEAPAGGSDFTCDDVATCPIVTTLQTDLSNLVGHVDDVEQESIDADAILQANIDTVASNLADHVNDTENPHKVSLEQARAEDNFVDGEIDMNGKSVRNLPAPTNADEAVNKAYVDGLMDRVLKQPQAFTPAGNYPTTYNGNAIQANDSFRITAAGSVGAQTVNADDLLIALVDAPGQTDANWQILESNRDQASETVKGVAKIVSQTEIQNELSTNNTDIVTSQKFWLGINRMVQVAWTWAQKQIFSTAPRFSSVNANQYLKSDGSKDLTGVDNIPVADVTGAEAVANKDTDGTLAANSDTKYASQKATKTYVDTKAATKADKYYAPHNHSVNTYTLLESDNNTLQRMDYATAIAVTIPNDTNAPTIQIGYVFRFVQLGAGQITLGPDSGVTINNRNGLKTAGQYAVIAIEKTAANTWLCYGDTTT